MADITVVTSSDIQAKYRKLYKFMMEYLWDFKVIESLANLEIACYKTFPDKEEMLNSLKELKVGISRTYSELSDDDKPEFEDTFNGLKTLIEKYDPETAGVDLYTVAEPVDIPQVDDNPTKEVFHAGDIQHHHSDENDEDAENDEVIEEKPNRLANPFEEE